MGLGKIVVETSQLDTASSKVSDLARNYEEEYTKLYKLIGELQSSWAGKDNTAYTAQIEGFKDDFQKMHGLMVEYSEFLSKTAKKYRETQEQVKNDASKLRTNA